MLALGSFMLKQNASLTYHISLGVPNQLMGIITSPHTISASHGLALTWFLLTLWMKAETISAVSTRYTTHDPRSVNCNAISTTTLGEKYEHTCMNI